MNAVALDLDAVLGDTWPLWRDWLEDVARRTRIALDLPDDRVEASRRLDVAIGNWPALLERFAEDRAPVYFRPDSQVNAALRWLQARQVRIGVFTDAPEALARVALAHLGAERRLEAVEAGADALERLLAELGADATVVGSRDELTALAT